MLIIVKANYFKTNRFTFITELLRYFFEIGKVNIHYLSSHHFQGKNKSGSILAIWLSSYIDSKEHVLTKPYIRKGNYPVSFTRKRCIRGLILFLPMFICFSALHAGTQHIYCPDKNVIIKSDTLLGSSPYNLSVFNKSLITGDIIFFQDKSSRESKGYDSNKNPTSGEIRKEVRPYLKEGDSAGLHFLFFFLAFAIIKLFFYLRFNPKQQSPNVVFPPNIKPNPELKNINTRWERLFSIIAHDLRSPFNVLLNYTDILVDDFDKLNRDDIKKHLLKLHKSAHKNYQLTQNLLSWALLQRGGFKINKRHVKVKKLIDESIYLCSDGAAQKSINIVNRCSINLIGKIDIVVATSILSNLINNALKFTPKNGIITINSKKLNSNILIRVDDNGIGMSNDILNNLCDLNKMISRKGTENEKGTGFGLILCKELIHLHKGKMRIRSKIKKGTSVLLLF